MGYMLRARNADDEGLSLTGDLDSTDTLDFANALEMTNFIKSTDIAYRYDYNQYAYVPEQIAYFVAYRLDTQGGHPERIDR